MHALVMELVEGDDLSQRIARGAIPIDEVLPIAKQIAEVWARMESGEVAASPQILPGGVVCRGQSLRRELGGGSDRVRSR
ncbi:MAG: hypothetical protein A3H97_12555 [Acidobacteria bacterium RIFCSPLOWO2_02_FULL_65_29]|nr:MAG: hypothetical protein A3H97_12555 [Acidobacteria bacterium RIFCSPLOWO2_02_FULL_65_29]